MAVFSLDISADDVGHEDDYLVAYATPPLSAGITAPKSSRFRFVGSEFFGGLPLFAGPAYVRAFGSPPVGAVFFVDLYAVNSVSGQVAPRVRSKVTVA